MRLRLTWGASAFQLEVVNGREVRWAGAGVNGPAPGFGLLGMGERAELAGGSISAGLDAHGDWRVVLGLPRPDHVSSTPDVGAGTGVPS